MWEKVWEVNSKKAYIKMKRIADVISASAIPVLMYKYTVAVKRASICSPAPDLFSRFEPCFRTHNKPRRDSDIIKSVTVWSDASTH
jgi:hypothetical protein